MDEINYQASKTQTELSIELSSGRTTHVEVFHYVGRFGSDDVVIEVNWAGIGSVSPEDAMVYAKLIDRAAAFATTLQRLGLKTSAGQQYLHAYGLEVEE